MTIIIILVIAFIFIFGQYKYCLYHWNENLYIDVKFSKDIVGVGDKFDIVENVKNHKRLPLPIFRLKYQTDKNLIAVALKKDGEKLNTDKFYYSDTMSVRGYEELTRKLECSCKKRGIYTIDQLYVTTHDLMLFHSFYDIQKVSTSILVYPDRVDYEKNMFQYNQLNGEIVSRLQYLEDPFEFKGIREYLPGDGIRKINYKASARSNDLMVNVFNQTLAKAVCIICDVSNNHHFCSEELIEDGLRLAKSLAEDLLEAGYEVSFETNGLDYFNHEQVRVLSGGGKKHMFDIHSGMAIIDLSQKTPDLENIALDDNSTLNNTFYVIISSNQTESMCDYFRTIFVQNDNALWVVPTDRSTEYVIPEDLRKYTKEWKKDEL